MRVDGCVTVDGAAAAAASVSALTAGEGRWTVPVGDDGCFRVERPVGGLSHLFVSAPQRGMIVVGVLPIAGTLSLELPLPPEGGAGSPVIRSDDHASRLAAVADWYRSSLRGAPSRENLQTLVQRQGAEGDPLMRTAYGLIYLALARTRGAPAEVIDAQRVRDALAALSPTHIAWSLEPEAIVLAMTAGDVGPEYVRRVLDEHPDAMVLGAAALALASAATEAGDPGSVRAVLARLRERGADTMLGKLALELDPDDRLAEGKPLPPFKLHALDGGPQIDSAALRGKVFVLHFWATWCRPCVEKLPALADLYTRHAAEGLEIVSLSIDEDPKTVVAFRQDGHAMPWTHAWERSETADALRAQYQVAGSTKAILVGRDGVVVAEHLYPGDTSFAARLAEALAKR